MLVSLGWVCAVYPVVSAMMHMEPPLEVLLYQTRVRFRVASCSH